MRCFCWGGGGCLCVSGWVRGRKALCRSSGACLRLAGGGRSGPAASVSRGGGGGGMGQEGIGGALATPTHHRTPKNAVEGNGPERRPQRRLDRQLEEVAKAVGGGYCRLHMPLRLALGLRGTVAGHELGPLEGGWGVPPPLPMHPCAVF